jgi:hypothetical protein
VEATSVTPFASRALDRGLPAVIVALGRHLRPALAPPRGAVEAATERPNLGHVSDLLAERVWAHRSMDPPEEQRAEASVRGRAQDLLDSWAKVAERQRTAGARLVYQRFENADGPPLLRESLDPDLGTLDADARKFKAPRSLRDVEPPVNLWVRSLDNIEVEAPAEDEPA